MENETTKLKGLKILRKQLGMSQDQLAYKVGIAQTTLSGYENGERKPNINTLTKIAECLHCSIDNLLNGVNYKSDITFDDLKIAAKPLVELLQKKGCPHKTAIVTDNSVKIVGDEIGIPFMRSERSDKIL